MEPVVDGNVPLGHNLEVAEGETLEVLPVDFAVVMERERDAKFQVVKDAETDKQVFVVGGGALIEFRLVSRFVCVVAFDAGRLSVVDDFEAARNKKVALRKSLCRRRMDAACRPHDSHLGGGGDREGEQCGKKFFHTL